MGAVSASLWLKAGGAGTGSAGIVRIQAATCSWQLHLPLPPELPERNKEAGAGRLEGP